MRIIGDSPEDIIPTLQQTNEIPYINMIIKEVKGSFLFN